VLRLDLAGGGPLPDLPGVAAIAVPLLGLIELRRIGRTLLAVDRRPGEVRSCPEADGRDLVGATITEIDPASQPAFAAAS
jgi:hypothetical protein